VCRGTLSRRVHHFTNHQRWTWAVD
jgi:hypothetical protein